MAQELERVFPARGRGRQELFVLYALLLAETQRLRGPLEPPTPVSIPGKPFC
jgi:hypothetical protein